MADITISLPDDRMLSIDSIEVSEFLNVWDALMGSRVINSLLGDEKNRECHCGKTELDGYTFKKLLGIDIDEVLQNRINIEYPPGSFPKGNRYLKKWFGVDGEGVEGAERDYVKATEIIGEDEYYDFNECIYITALTCVEYMFLRCRPFLGKELAERG